MAKSDKQKLKLLYLKQLLEQKTDEYHPITTQQIIDALALHGISAERKSIYSDIACLEEFGMDICTIHGKGGGYYLASREFELPELKLLVDAVQASKFLTERKSIALIRKLETLASTHEASSLRRQVVVSGRVKTMNESIFYNVDRIHEAIAENKQISFKYFDWGRDKEKHFRDKTYTVSPFALCWDAMNYYLVAYSDEHGITHYRVDKMAAIQKTNLERVKNEQTKNIDVSRYGKNVFSMYSGEKQTVKMRFSNHLAGVVIDRFGNDAMLIPDGDDGFLFTTEIVVSPQFYGWLSAFGTEAKILYPASVAQDFADLLRKTAQLY